MNAPLNCELCPRLCASRRTVVNGTGPKDARIMVVSCNPDAQDEKHGEPLYHRAWAGKKLRRYLLPLANIDPSEVRYENIVRCNPPKGKKGKPSAPTSKEIETCRGFLQATIEEVKPDIIITLGSAALKWFLPDEKISQVHGQTFTWRYKCKNSGIGCNKARVVGSTQENEITTDMEPSTSVSIPKSKRTDLLGSSSTVKSLKENTSSIPAIIPVVSDQNILDLEHLPITLKTEQYEGDTTEQIKRSTSVDISSMVFEKTDSDATVKHVTENAHEHEIKIVSMLHPDNAKPGYNPKLALVMDEDWRRLGEYDNRKDRNDSGLYSVGNNGSDYGDRATHHVSPAQVPDYRIVSGKLLARLLTKANVTRFAFDFETVKASNQFEGTFQACRAVLLGYSVCWEEGTSYYVDCSKTLDLSHIKPWLEDPAIKVIAHNAKYEWVVAQNYGVNITNLDDTKLLAYLLRKPGTGLKSLSWSEMGIVQTRFEDVDENDMPAFGLYGAEDSDMTLRLFNKLWPEINAAKLTPLYRKIEQPLIPVLGRMEMLGVVVDPAPLHKLEGEIRERLDEVDREIATLYPHDINWRSVPQKQNALFGKPDGGEWKHEDGQRRLTYKEWSKNERENETSFNPTLETEDQPTAEQMVPFTKLLSYIPPGLGITTRYGIDTDIPTLHRIELAGNVHPIIPLLIERSTITRALSGEIVKLPKLRQEDGRVHASFHQSGGWEELGGDTKEGTDTGRLSCSGPNLNNITNHGDTSRPYVAEWGSTIRTSFVAPKGWVVVKADVGQEEPRIAAYLSGDTILRDAVSSGDMYLEAAALAYDKPATEITHEERQIGKRMFMAWLNRAGPSGIQKSAYWLTKEEAQAVIGYMCERFHVFEAWCAQQLANLQRDGYVTTYFGRHVNYPEIWTGNQAVVGKCQRACIPGSIQGTAGDVLKQILYRLNTAYSDLGLRSELVLCVHDEVVSYVPEDELDLVTSLHMGLLEGLLPISLPMEVLVGPNWGEGIQIW